MRVSGKGVLRRFRDQWYLVFICFVLVLRVFFWFSPSHGDRISFLYLWPAVITAGALLIRSRYRSLPKGFALVAGIFAWLMVSCAVNGDPYLTYNRMFILGMFITLISCYLVVPTLRDAERRRGFHILIAVYCLLMLLLALLGIGAALTGSPVHTPFADEGIRIADGRLYFFRYHPNEAASALVVGFLLLLYGALATRRAAGKALLALCAAVLGFAIALTGSRTSIVIAACGVGACAFWIIYTRLLGQSFWLRWPLSLAGLCIVALLSYQAITASIGAATTIASRAEVGIPAAMAEAAVDTQTETPAADASVGAVDLSATVHMDESRINLDDIGTFNQRVQLWEAGIAYLKGHPKAFVFGVPDNVVSRIPATVGRPEFHLHNAYLEMLLLGGIPGLLMYLGYLYIVFRACWQLAFAKGSPLASRFLGVIPVLIAVNGITEIYPLFSGNVMDMMAFVISGAVVALAGDRQACAAPRLRSDS